MGAVSFLGRGSIPDGSVTRAKIAPATLKHARVTTGSVAGQATTTVTCTWGGGAFPNANYTVSAVALEDTAGGNTLEVLKVLNQLAASVQVLVRNNDLGAKTGTVHAIGIGD